MKNQALLSAYTKGPELVAFAKGLQEMDIPILASAGTKKFLDGHGIVSRDVGDIVGAPILGHRVVTLSREVHAAILARPNVPEDMAELERIGVDPIRVVYVDLYPLRAELEDKNSTYYSVLEKIDIGGPTLLRAAAKSSCLVLSSIKQFEAALSFIRNEPDNPIVQRRVLAKYAAEAELAVDAYVALTARFYQSVADGNFPEY